MNPTDCAVCEKWPGNEKTYDGRLICRRCAAAHPVLMAQAKPIPIMDAYASFVGLVVSNRERRA
jgi:hypothetical protein